MQKRTVQAFVLAATVAVVASPAEAQDRLKTMPGYDRYRAMGAEIGMSVKSGALSVTWKDARNFEYLADGQYYRYDIGSRQPGPIEPPHENSGSGRTLFGTVDRGRQLDTAVSPDGSLTAYYKDRNFWISAPDGSNPVAITSD